MIKATELFYVSKEKEEEILKNKYNEQKKVEFLNNVIEEIMVKAANEGNFEVKLEITLPFKLYNNSNFINNYKKSLQDLGYLIHMFSVDTSNKYLTVDISWHSAII